MIKILSKPGIEGKFLSWAKAICENPTANIKLFSPLPEIGNKINISTFQLVLDISKKLSKDTKIDFTSRKHDSSCKKIQRNL